MTIFSNNPYDRSMERLMMTVPNFVSRGVGFRFTEAQVFITTNPATPTEILTATMRQIRCPHFHKRFNEYIPCLLLVGEGHKDGFIIDTQGYDYARYTAHIPNAEQLAVAVQYPSLENAVRETALAADAAVRTPNASALITAAGGGICFGRKHKRSPKTCGYP